MATTQPPKLQWHGFSDWIGFIRATISLGAVIAAGLWAMLTWAMDDRYVKHEDLQTAVSEIKTVVRETVTELKCQSLLEDMSRLEQTIRYKRSQGEDIGLETDLLAADQRLLVQYKGCVR